MLGNRVFRMSLELPVHEGLTWPSKEPPVRTLKLSYGALCICMAGVHTITRLEVRHEAGHGVRHRKQC
jgi:hypothetical protein